MSTYDSLRNDGGEAIAKRPETRSLSEQSHRVLDEVRELGSTALATASEAATELRERGSAAVSSTKEKASAAKGQLDHAIGEHPMTAILVALGVGALLGFTMHRR